MKTTVVIVGADTQERASGFAEEIMELFHKENIPMVFASDMAEKRLWKDVPCINIIEEELTSPTVPTKTISEREAAEILANNLVKNVLPKLPEGGVFVVQVPGKMVEQLAKSLYETTNAGSLKSTLRILPLGFPMEGELNLHSQRAGHQNCLHLPYSTLEPLITKEVQRLKSISISPESLAASDLQRKVITIDPVSPKYVDDTLKKLEKAVVTIELGPLPHKFIITFRQDKFEEIKGILKPPTAPARSVFGAPPQETMLYPPQNN